MPGITLNEGVCNGFLKRQNHYFVAVVVVNILFLFLAVKMSYWIINKSNSVMMFCFQRFGQGVMTYSSGDIYEGVFEYDLRSKLGKMTYKDGSVYEGSWDNGLVSVMSRRCRHLNRYFVIEHFE